MSWYCKSHILIAGSIPFKYSSRSINGLCARSFMELFYSNNDSPLSIYTSPYPVGISFRRAREPLREGKCEKTKANLKWKFGVIFCMLLPSEYFCTVPYSFKTKAQSPNVIHCFLPMFYLSKNCMHNKVQGWVEILFFLQPIGSHNLPASAWLY